LILFFKQTVFSSFSAREISTNTRVVRDGAGRVLEKTVTKTSAVRRQEPKPSRDFVKRSSTISSVSY